MKIKIKTDIKLIKKRDINLNTLKKWVAWLNDKEITMFNDKRFKKHTISSQKKYLRDEKVILGLNL